MSTVGTPHKRGHARSRSSVAGEETPILQGWLARCGRVQEVGTRSTFRERSWDSHGAERTLTIRFTLLCRESGVVSALLNKRFGALYPTALVTYRKETDEASSGGMVGCVFGSSRVWVCCRCRITRCDPC